MHFDFTHKKKDLDRSVSKLAIATDTIKILHDDDAMEMFKKTLPGSSS